MTDQIKDNEFNADLKRRNSNECNMDAKPRSSSFKDSDKFVRTKSGTFVRMDSDVFENQLTSGSRGEISGSRSGTQSSTGMPDFRQSVKAHLQKTKDEMPQGLMREVMETYKPHILSRRRRLIEDCVRDLRLNNDHIHIIEQEMRKAIQVKIKSIFFNAKFFDRILKILFCFDSVACGSLKNGLFRPDLF